MTTRLSCLIVSALLATMPALGQPASPPHAPGQPPPDRLGIHAQAGGDVVFAQSRPQQGPAQWLVHRWRLPERGDTPDRTRRRP